MFFFMLQTASLVLGKTEVESAGPFAGVQFVLTWVTNGSQRAFRFFLKGMPHKGSSYQKYSRPICLVQSLGQVTSRGRAPEDGLEVCRLHATFVGYGSGSKLNHQELDRRL